MDVVLGEVRVGVAALEVPTPEDLLAEAVELEARAARKERLAEAECCSAASAGYLRRDAGIFREEAGQKRAKAARLQVEAQG